MLQGLATKVIINQVIKALEKVSDKRIASDHEKRIEKLEKTGGIRIRSKEPRQALKRRLSNYDVGAMVSKTKCRLGK